MSIHTELDKWAFNIEEKNRNGENVSRREQKLHQKLIQYRDKYWDIYITEFRKTPNRNGNVVYCPIPKLCGDRCRPEFLKRK